MKLIYGLIISLFLCPPVHAGFLLNSYMVGGGAATGEWFGPTSEDRASNVAVNYTVIDKNDSSPATGSVTSIKIYTNGAVTGAEFACFYVDGGASIYTSNAGGTSGSVNLDSGANTLIGGGTDFTSFPCDSGEFLGVYIPSGGGAAEWDTTGGIAVYYVAGDQIPASAVTFTAGLGNILSLEFYVE